MLERLANTIYWFFNIISIICLTKIISFISILEGHLLISWPNIEMMIFLAVTSFLIGRTIKYILAGK